MQIENEFAEEYIRYSKLVLESAEILYNNYLKKNETIQLHNQIPKTIVNTLQENNKIKYVNCPNPFFLDETLLYLALKRNNIEIVKIACTLLSNPMLLCKNGRNAISYAVEYSDIEIIKLLISYDFPILNLNGLKNNPVVLAYELKKYEIVDYLLVILKEISIYHFELLENSFKNDNERLKVLKNICRVQN